MKNKIEKFMLSAIVAGASILSSSRVLAQDYVPKRTETEVNIPYLAPTTYTSRDNNKGNFVIGHGLNETSANWSNLNQTMQNRGFQTQTIDLPNGGHMGYEQNRIVIGNTISNMSGQNIFFDYSTNAVSKIKYMQENPKFVENIKGSTFIFLDPAIKQNAHIEFFASPLMRPIAAVAMGKLSPSQTELELTRQDTNKFIDTTLAGLPKLAENLAKNDIRVHVINLKSEVVNGGAIKQMADTFKAGGVKVYEHTPADIMNNYIGPAIGNKGNFLGGEMNAFRTTTPQFARDSSSHFIWSNNYKLGIDKFVADIAYKPNISPVNLSDIVSTTGVLQNYPKISDNVLQITGSLSPRFETTISPQLFNANVSMPHATISPDFGSAIQNISFNQNAFNVSTPPVTFGANGIINYVQPLDFTKGQINLMPTIDYTNIVRTQNNLNVTGNMMMGR